MNQLFPYTIDDQLAEAERELKMRQSVYPRLVRDGKMSQQNANHRIALMAAILATLQSVKLAAGRI